MANSSGAKCSTQGIFLILQSETATSSAAEMKLLWGAPAIARALNITRRKAYHLLETGSLPARKIGGSWVADTDRLRQAIVGEEGRI